MKLAEMTCSPVKQGTATLSRTDAEVLLPQIAAWALGEKEIKRDFRFRDFREAMHFVNKVAETANEEDHHPDIFISYNKVALVFSTHKINGLSMNDFIMAAKIDLLDHSNRMAA